MFDGAMNPFDIALARAELDLEGEELKFLDRLGESWGDWVMHAEVAKLTPVSTANLLGIAKELPPARGVLDLREEYLMRIDREVAHLVQRYQHVMFVEYIYAASPNVGVGFASDEFKARRYFGCSREKYRPLRRAAQASLMTRLLPDFTVWHREFVW